MNRSLENCRIGFIGLGNMGFPMARHIHTAGADIMVWNRSVAIAERACELGMKRATSIAELASHIEDGIACINLTTTEVVQDIVFGANGLASHFHRNAIVIDFGTTDVDATRRFAAAQNWLDAPVSGGQVGAENATLSIMVGGSASHFERAKPVLTVVGKRVTHMGPSGAGQVTKLANQLIVAQTIDAVAQALRLAELSGVESSKVREALLGGFAESRILDLHGDRMVHRNFQAGGRAALQLKDVRLICELAEKVGLKSSTLDNCRQQWEHFIASGYGDLDHSGLFLLYENT